MRLIGATLQNYKSFTSSREITGLKTANALIGPNNEGKSTFLESLMFPRYLSSFISSGHPETSQQYILDRTPGKILGPLPEVELRFDLEERDIPAAWQQGSRPMLSYTIKWAGPPDEAPTMLFETTQITLSSPEGNQSIPLLFPSENDLTYCGTQLSQVIESWRHGKREQISRADVRNRGKGPYESMDDGPGHGVLTSLPDWAQRLVYVPSHREIVPIGVIDGYHGELDNNSLPAFAHRMRTNEESTFDGFQSIVSRLIPSIKRVYTHLEDGSRVSIRVSDQDSVQNTSEAYRLDTVGEGVNEILLLVAAIWLSPDQSIILIEEPERGLHPGSQRLLLKAAVEHARQRSKQLFWTTHSTVFAPLTDDCSVHLVAIGGRDVTTVTNVGKEQVDAIVATLGLRNLDVYNYDLMVLVDGETEESVLPEVATHILGESLANAIHFEPLRGDLKSQVELAAHLIRVVHASHTRVFIFADDDKDTELAIDDLARRFQSEGGFARDQTYIWGAADRGATPGGPGAEFEDNFSAEELIDAANQLGGGVVMDAAEFARRLEASPTKRTSKVLERYYAQTYQEGWSKPTLGRLIAPVAISKMRDGKPRGKRGTTYEFEDALNRLRPLLADLPSAGR